MRKDGTIRGKWTCHCGRVFKRGAVMTPTGVPGGFRVSASPKVQRHEREHYGTMALTMRASSDDFDPLSQEDFPDDWKCCNGAHWGMSHETAVRIAFNFAKRVDELIRAAGGVGSRVVHELPNDDAIVPCCGKSVKALWSPGYLSADPMKVTCNRSTVDHRP